jgi:hypothetical protein
MAYFIGWLIGSTIIAIAAKSRGRNGFGWFFVALLISPVLSGILLFVLPRLRPSYAQIAAIAQIEATAPSDSYARQLLAAEIARSAPRQAPPLSNRQAPPLSNFKQNVIFTVALSIVGGLVVIVIAAVIAQHIT